MSKQVKPNGWHEFIPGDTDLNGNVRCALCHHLHSVANHQRCADCGSYDIYLICGAGCGEGRCKEHAKGHWCKATEEHFSEMGGR